MNEFEITVTEALVRKIKVKADTYEEALNIVENDYKKENIVLDSSDCIGYDIS